MSGWMENRGRHAVVVAPAAELPDRAKLFAGQRGVVQYEIDVMSGHYFVLCFGAYDAAYLEAEIKLLDEWV